MQLLTTRLLLREFVADDIPVVQAYHRDPRYMHFYDWETRSPEFSAELVQRFIAAQHEPARWRFQLAVTLRDSGRLIGNCGVRRDAANLTEANIGYELDPNYWGQGYATEAARAVVAFGFQVLRVTRISAHCVAYNTASANVLQKIGLTFVDRTPSDHHPQEDRYDQLNFAIPAATWRQKETV